MLTKEKNGHSAFLRSTGIRNLKGIKVLRFFVLLTFLSFLSCVSYYEKSRQLQTYVVSGDFLSADKLLDADKKGETGVNRVLYWFNRGVVAFMNKEYEKSNLYFSKADRYIEDYRWSIGSEALALVSNPMVKPYRPEDFEGVMIHYYMALNYIYLKKYEDALVEARRINIQLQRMNTRYKKSKNKYAKDAFAHVLMGLIYEAMGDDNNAFIAYRNALEVYEGEYAKLFGIKTPLQLKRDLLRTALAMGFEKDVKFYEQKFKMKAEPDDPGKGYLVFFWMNGFGPVKGQWSITFFNAGYHNGWVTFKNAEYGLSFPIYVGDRSKDEKNAIANLSVVRVAFPKYVERKRVFYGAKLIAGGKEYPLELAENINAIAFQCLNDRMVREIASGIARLVTKKAIEEAVRSKDETIGALIGMLNAATENADTRNWQTLPYSISYARIPFTEGVHQVELNAYGSSLNSTSKFEFNIHKGETTFYAFHQLNTHNVGY